MSEFKIFYTLDGRQYFDQCLNDMIQEINSKTNEYILNVNMEEWKSYYMDKFDYEPLKLYTDQTVVKFLGKGKTRIDRENRTFEVDNYRFVVKIPFTGFSFLFKLSPTSRAMNHPMVELSQGDQTFIECKFTLHEENENLFENEKKRIIDTIGLNVPNINNDLIGFKQSIENIFKQAYEAKRKKVLSENSFFEKINIKIDSGTDKIFKVETIQRKKIPEPFIDKKVEQRFSNSPSLPDKFYDDVLEVINTFFKAMEKKPSTYKNKSEEDLRDYVLPTLETRYSRTTVTGETFNKGGKTDILVKYEDGTNLFVAECKVWKGESVFHETINQLFDRYLTWRDSKTAIIFFVRNKEISKVVNAIQTSIKKHPYFIRENGTRGTSSFSYILHFPLDKDKIVYTEILVFHFPEESGINLQPEPPTLPTSKQG